MTSADDRLPELPPVPVQPPERRLASAEEKDPGKLLASSAESLAHAKREGHHPPHHPAHHWRHTARWLGGALTGVLLYAAAMAVHDGRQDRQHVLDDARARTGGDPRRGPALMRAHGCAHCHTIAGVPGANGLVGPPLTGIASRVYIGGVVTNTPDNLVRWIMNPKAIDPMTAMPVVGVTEEQARHIAAYLYTLR